MNRPTREPSPTGFFSVASLLIVSAIVVIVTWMFLAGGQLPMLLRAVVINGSVAVMWLAAAMGIGRWILRLARFDLTRALRAVLATAIGLGIISLVTLGLGLAGGLNRWTAIGLIVSGAVLFISSLLKGNANRWKFLYESAGMNWIALLAAPAAAIMVACATLPPGLLWGDEPAGYDVTEYHLQAPREWFEAGRITPLNHNVYSFMPFNVEMHYLLAMHVRGGPWHGMYLAQLMHAAFMLLTAAAVYSILVDRHPRGAMIAAVLTIVPPWLPLLGSVAYDEGGLLLFGTLAIGLAIRSIESTQPIKSMILAGVMAGFACGCKLTAGPMILLPIPIVLLVSRCAWRLAIPSAIAFWIAGFVIFSPWMIRNVAWTHNPLFPEATSIFGKAHWTDMQVQRWIKANHQPRPEQQSVAGRLRAGWDQIAGDPRYGYLLIPLAMLAVIIRRDPTAITLFLLLVYEAIFWLFFTHLQSRFFVLAIPLCALIVGGLKSKEWLIASSSVTIVVAAFGANLLWQKLQTIQERITVPIFTVAGIEQAGGLQTVPADTGDKQVELIGDGQAFLCDVPMSRLYYRTVFDVDVHPGQSAIDAWRNGWPVGDNVITAINPEELMRFHRTYYEIPKP